MSKGWIGLINYVFKVQSGPAAKPQRGIRIPSSSFMIDSAFPNPLRPINSFVYRIKYYGKRLLQAYGGQCVNIFIYIEAHFP